jgi:hypothetical protein
MTDAQIIASISGTEAYNDSATIDAVYNHCAALMAKYDSDKIAQEIYSWEWADVLLLLNDSHPEYEILAIEAQRRVAEDIRGFYA